MDPTEMLLLPRRSMELVPESKVTVPKSVTWQFGFSFKHSSPPTTAEDGATWEVALNSAPDTELDGLDGLGLDGLDCSDTGPDGRENSVLRVGRASEGEGGGSSEVGVERMLSDEDRAGEGVEEELG
jgi:hypothetical protein